MTLEEALSTHPYNATPKTTAYALETLQDRFERIQALLKRWHTEGLTVNDPQSPSIFIECCLELENELTGE